MPEPHLDPAIEQKIIDLAHNLYVAIEGGDPAQIVPAQQALSAAAEALWERINGENISEKDKAIARLLGEMTIKDLPALIQDPKNYPAILREIRLLKNSLILLK